MPLVYQSLKIKTLKFNWIHTKVSAVSANSSPYVIFPIVYLQAAQETKHKMGPAADKIYLIHFNDVYNIESGDKVSLRPHSTLTLIQPGKGRFTLAYISPDYLYGSHAGLPG